MRIIDHTVGTRSTVAEQPFDEARAEIERWAGKEFAAGALRGLPSIMENAARLNAGREIRGVTVDGPFVHGFRFAMRFEFDRGDSTETKMSLYTVHNGAISREEVYYFDH